ncbi:DUF1631 family protein [Eionea flava]
MADTKYYHEIIDQSHLALTPNIRMFAEELIRNVGVALEHYAEHTTTHKQHAIALDCLNIFTKSKDNISNDLSEQLSIGFYKFKTNELDTQVRENEFHKEAWSLVDDDVLEENISIRSFSSGANQAHKEKIWQLEQRLTFMNKGLPINENNNPLSPLQFFSGLRFSLKKLPIDIAGKNVCYKVLSELLNKQYPQLLNLINSILIEEDILPRLNYATQHSPIVSKDAPLSNKENKENNLEKTYPIGSKKPATPNNEQTNSAIANNQSTDNNNEIELDEKNQQETLDNQEGSSQIPLVNAIRNLLQRARNIGGSDLPIPIVNNMGSGQHTEESNGLTQSAHNTSTTANNEPSLEADIVDIKDTNLSANVESTPIVLDTSHIIDAVESVQQSAATAHFFSNNDTQQVLTTPTNIAANSTQVYQQLAKESPDGSINAKNMYTIDMVGMLFEYILADENLPDSIKTLLSHLHTPFLKLAFIDESFFENKEHKSRMLLDSLADAGANFVGHDGTSQYNMYNEIKAVVQRIIKDFKNDINLFAETLIEFTLLKKRVTHMHNLRERNSIEKKRGQEKHEQAKLTARKEIKSRIEGRRVPSSIINLLSPWFVYLTFLQLKDENDSKQWTEALGVIDNLITYCSIKRVKDNGREIEKGFDTIIKQVEAGLTDIAYNPAKMATALSDLEQLKSNVMNRQTIKTTVTKQDPKKDVNITSEITGTPTPEEERVMNYIKLIDPGTWIEYDKNTRMKVNGFSAETRKYILVNQSNQEVTMLSRLELARDILSEKATILDGTAKPLFERALERIKHNLDKQMQLNESMGE